MKLRKDSLLVGLSICLLLGSSSFGSEVVRLLEKNQLDACGADPASLSLNGERKHSQEGSAEYTLILENYVGDCWIFIRDDIASLVFNIEGGEIKLTPRDAFSYRKKTHARELVYYDISAMELERLARAERIEIEILCENFTLKRCFDKKNFKKLREFYYGSENGKR